LLWLGRRRWRRNSAGSPRLLRGQRRGWTLYPTGLNVAFSGTGARNQEHSADDQKKDRKTLVEPYNVVAIQEEKNTERDQDGGAHQSASLATHAAAIAISDVRSHRGPPTPGWVVRL